MLLQPYSAWSHWHICPQLSQSHTPSTLKSSKNCTTRRRLSRKPTATTLVVTEAGYAVPRVQLATPTQVTRRNAALVERPQKQQAATGNTTLPHTSRQSVSSQRPKSTAHMSLPSQRRHVASRKTPAVLLAATQASTVCLPAPALAR